MAFFMKNFASSTRLVQWSSYGTVLLMTWALVCRPGATLVQWIESWLQPGTAAAHRWRSCVPCRGAERRMPSLTPDSSPRALASPPCCRLASLTSRTASLWRPTTIAT